MITDAQKTSETPCATDSRRANRIFGARRDCTWGRNIFSMPLIRMVSAPFRWILDNVLLDYTCVLLESADFISKMEVIIEEILTLLFALNIQGTCFQSISLSRHRRSK